METLETTVIAFGHRMQVGKDTAAAAIIRACPEVKRYAFADCLKKEVNLAAFAAGSMARLFDNMQSDGRLPEWVTYDEAAPTDDPLCPFGKQRKLLQWWGTEYRRTEDPLYWVHKLSLQIHAEKPAIALISDMRFKNEFYWVKGLGGKTVNVVRIGRTFDSTHASEDDLDGAPYDYVLAVPDGDVESVRTGAVQLFKKILKEKEDEKSVSSNVTSYGLLGGR